MSKVTSRLVFKHYFSEEEKDVCFESSFARLLQPFVTQLLTPPPFRVWTVGWAGMLGMRDAAEQAAPWRRRPGLEVSSSGGPLELCATTTTIVASVCILEWRSAPQSSLSTRKWMTKRCEVQSNRSENSIQWHFGAENYGKLLTFWSVVALNLKHIWLEFLSGWAKPYYVIMF